MPEASTQVSVVGQRCVSEREPELGLGVVATLDPAAKRIGVDFPATGEKRLYALGTPVLKRVRFGVGERLKTRDDRELTIATVEEQDGLVIYGGDGRRVPETEVSDQTSTTGPLERLAAGQADESDVFDLRFRALRMQAKIRQSEVRGFLGGRVELIPHQFYVVHEVAGRQVPRVLLADEVGLGKTIEACLILQRLLAVGQARRVLVLVPESLTHQWFVELLRRFNLWFSIYDEARCAALEDSDPGENPFAASQLALANVDFLAHDARRAEQVIAAGWDMVVVDEAHHLAWAPGAPSLEYALVEQLARRSPGILLLTATPTQLGLAGHFARLRLLDPDRYSDYDRFVEEAGRFGQVAEIAERIVEEKPLRPKDRTTLKAIFNRDPERLNDLLDALAAKRAGAGAALLRTLLDQHGTGRVMFRNTRAAMTGFPKRKLCPAPVESGGNVALLARIARELAAEEGAMPVTAPSVEPARDRPKSGTLAGMAAAADEATVPAAGQPGEPEVKAEAAAVRYSYKDDPRIDWLAGFLREHRAAKVLLICRSQRKVAAIDGALQERIKVKSALFHEGLPLVQRDRNAAWFAEPEGAQLLLCSEIGSEGRNFQFAHHLVLFDLPLNPGLVEQRIGRLDRIGQTQTIRIHVPYVQGSADECVVEWYRRGLDAFESPVHGGEEYQSKFRDRLLELALRFGDGGERSHAELESLIAETATFQAALAEKLKKGRDRLLELASFNPAVARQVTDQVTKADGDPALRNFLIALLDHFGVRVKEHEEGDVFLDPAHAYLEAFPSIPPDGMLVTFDRQRALAREDIRFVTADHPLVQDAIDLLIDSPAGTTAFGRVSAQRPNLLLEAVFVLEVVADARWHVDRFLAPSPVRVVVDVRGGDLTGERSPESFAGYVEDGDFHRFLEQPGFSPELLRRLAGNAEAIAERRSEELRRDAIARATERLEAERQRLVDLRKVNDHVRPEEITLAEQKLLETRGAIAAARLRLDSVRLIVEGG